MLELSEKQLEDAFVSVFDQELSEPQKRIAVDIDLGHQRKLSLHASSLSHELLFPSDSVHSAHLAVNICNTTGKDPIYETDSEGTIARYDNAHGIPHTHSAKIMTDVPQEEQLSVFVATAQFLAKVLLELAKKKKKE